MTELQSRLDKIRLRITSDEFLDASRRNSEVPFYAFDYPTVSEEQVSNYLSWMLDDLARKSELRIQHVNVFELAISLINERGFYRKALAMEKDKDVSSLLSALKGPLGPDKIAGALKSKVNDQNPDMIFLSGVGAAYPLIRTHSLLNNLQPLLGNIPLVLFFPGRFSGQSLQLFGDLQETPYYRAFRLVD